MMLCIPNAKALGLVVSDKSIFHVFPYISICKTCDPWAGHFRAQWHNLNTLCSDLLGDDTYQIARLCFLWFQTRRFIHVFPYV